MWHSMQLEIQNWFDQKLQEFVEKENQNSRLTVDQWVGRYIHDGPHEWFFCEFPVLLFEWLAKLTFQKRNFQGGESTAWTPELIQEL